MSPVALSLGTTAGWTLGAALISAGRILAASIVVVRIRIAGFWGGWSRGAGLRFQCVLLPFRHSSA